jgi:uncharacterized protein YlxP (DUF503 family)
MITRKQMALARLFLQRLKERFPELELVNITASAVDSHDVWVNVVIPEDEDRRIAIRELSAEISTGFLETHGYSITVSSALLMQECITTTPNAALRHAD